MDGETLLQSDFHVWKSKHREFLLQLSCATPPRHWQVNTGRKEAMHKTPGVKRSKGTFPQGKWG